MPQNQIYPWNYQPMPKKPRDKKGKREILALTLSTVSLSLSQREKRREMRLGPMVRQGTKIEREIWWCTPGTMREREREREREERERERAEFVREREAWKREDKDKCERKKKKREHVKEIER